MRKALICHGPTAAMPRGRSSIVKDMSRKVDSTGICELDLTIMEFPSSQSNDGNMTPPFLEEIGHMNRKSFIVSVLAAGCFIVTAAILPSVGNAQMDNVKTSMAALKAKTAKLGAPKIEGNDPVGGKDVPGLYFGATKMNNYFDVVDEVVKENGGTATLFVKAGDEYVRVATNVKKDDGSRAIGTILDPNGPAIAMIKKGEAYYGDATILGKPYVTGYDPIKDASGNVIGIYYVGYIK
jgi:hypothetical protein